MTTTHLAGVGYAYDQNGVGSYVKSPPKKTLCGVPVPEKATKTILVDDHPLSCRACIARRGGVRFDQVQPLRF